MKLLCLFKLIKTVTNGFKKVKRLTGQELVRKPQAGQGLVPLFLPIGPGGFRVFKLFLGLGQCCLDLGLFVVKLLHLSLMKGDILQNRFNKDQNRRKPPVGELHVFPQGFQLLYQGLAIMLPRLVLLRNLALLIKDLGYLKPQRVNISQPGEHFPGRKRLNLDGFPFSLPCGNKVFGAIG